VEGVLEAWLKADAGRAVVIVTHDPAQAERLSTRALSFDAAGHHHFSQAKAEDAHA
jgi:ABC-type nitrate/sulfonate/bicarbonate transport system ATPase subunit